MNDQAATALWATLRQELEISCESSDDPRIALMPVAWRSSDELGEIVWPWLAMRAERPLDDLMAMVEPATQAIGLWRPDRKDWKSAWEECLAKVIDESLRHTPNQLEPEEVVSLLAQIYQVLSSDKAAPLQGALLRHAAPIRTMESMAKLRSALPSTTEIPEELLSSELRQVWLENALQRKELKLYGPHAMQQPMQVIEKAIQDIYRSIGDQALKAAGNGQMDVRTLTPGALNAVRAWRKAAEHYEAGGQLTNAVKQRPFSLLLFDEIEKAHPRILDKFLQILEDGRLTDGKGETVMFSDTVIVFTSNIGAAEVSYESQDVRNEFIQKVRQHFVHELKRPELLGRIGEANIIPFNFMRDDSFLIDIARAKLEPLRKGLKDKWGVSDLKLIKETEVLDLLIKDVDRGTGGRGVPNALTNKLIDPLADFLFEQMATPGHIRGKVIEVHIAGGNLIFELE